MRLKRFVCLFLSVFIAATVFLRPLTVFADYGEDDDMFDFLAEFVKQRNAAQQVKLVYDEYIKNGLSPDTAFSLATQAVSNVSTDTAALTNAIKNTWNNLTGSQKSNLKNLYNEGGGGSSRGGGGGRDFSISKETDEDLNLRVFDNDYKRNSNVINSNLGNYVPGITVVDMDTFNAISVPFLYRYNKTGSPLSDSSSNTSRYYNLFYVSSFQIGAPNYGYDYYGFTRTESPLVYSIVQYNADTQYFKLTSDTNAIFYCYSYSVSNGNFSYYKDWSSGYNRGTVPDSMQYVNTSFSFTPYHIGSYYVVPSTIKITPIETIINNYYTTDNNVTNNYYSYTTNINTSSDLPTDGTWLEELKKIVKGQQVTVINITINNYPDPTPEPDTPSPSPSPDNGNEETAPKGFFNSVTVFFNDVRNFFTTIIDHITQSQKTGEVTPSPSPTDEPTETPKPSESPSPSAPPSDDEEKPPSGWFGAIKEFLSNIVNYINPLSDKFFLKLALIPREDYVKEEFVRVRDSLNDKIPMVGQLIDMTGELITIFGGKSDTLTDGEYIRDSYTLPDPSLINAYSNEIPKFEFTLPESYGGETFSLIDLSYFDEYRGFIHGFIIVISVYFFVMRHLRKLPKVILH